MGRLPRINNTLMHEPGLPISTQMCTKNSTTLSCAMLAQNLTHPAHSTQFMHHFAMQAPGDTIRTLRLAHARKKLCSSCDKQKMQSIITRFLKIKMKQESSIPQLSFGVPFRLSTERVVAAHLHRELCGANKTCQPLQQVLCPGGKCLQRHALLPALLHTAALPRLSSLAETDSLWDRKWVWCPHPVQPNVFDTCSGSIKKNAWLNPSTRALECAKLIQQHSSSSSVVVNFCLLNAETQQLCSNMSRWRRDVQEIQCQASGNCDKTDFFYDPTTFNLREQEFVFDSVLRFYRQDVGRDCPTPSNPQQAANAQSSQKCASVKIEPLLVIVDNLRNSKRVVLLIWYHTVRVAYYVFELAVSATMDTVSILVDASSTAFEDTTTRLLREVRALVQVIGNFIEQMRDAFIELTFSKGIGKEVKEILVALCEIVKFFYQIWLAVGCPVIAFILEIYASYLRLLEIVLGWIPGLGTVQNFVGDLHDIVADIQDGLNGCTENEMFNCNLEAKLGNQAFDSGALPLPTRCWSSYLSFFGDNQRLSCSAADTCKDSRVSSLSERKVCSACPIQRNENIRNYACDQLVGFCTCGVPELTSTTCYANSDCETTEAACRLVDDDLQISRSSVPCAQCQYERMCLHTTQENVGVCACGARQRHFHVCSEHQYNQPVSLRLNNLCLFTETIGVVDFAMSSVIACQELDASTSSCAYVVDKNMFIARGSSRGRRRLLSMHLHVDSVTYNSVDSICRDALEVEALVHTRARCQEAFVRSNETLALLGLSRQLPPCALCSLADVTDAARNNPVAFVHLFSSPRLLASVLRRHGPFSDAVAVFAALHLQLANFALLASKNSTQIVFVEHRKDAVLVSVDDSVLPPPIARALEHFLMEMLQARATRLETGTANYSSVSTRRRLLFLQELVISVEKGVREGLYEVGRLHEAFSQSMSHILSYDYDLSRSASWPPQSTIISRASCNELNELLLIAMDVVTGVHQGWSTLTHQRSVLQSRPVNSLGEAWPKLLRQQGPGAPTDEVFKIIDQSDDVVAQWSAEAIDATLRAIKIKPRVFYDVIFSVASAANASFTCPYHAVQTCSAWRVRFWHAVVIVGLSFSAVAVVTGALGLSFVNSLFVPFFGLVLLQLCYGYTWTCLPMIPVCAWQDFTESVNVFLPLSLEIPDELKKLDNHCLVGGSLQRYPPPACLKTCREAPFAYKSWSNVLAWWIADIGATNFVLANTHRVPLLDYTAFNQELASRSSTIRRTSADSVRAHRVCAMLTSHLLIPYVVIFLLVIAFLANLGSALAAQFFPLFLLVCTLFTAVSVSSEEDSSDEEEEVSVTLEPK